MISLPGKMLSGPFARKLNFSMRLLNVRRKRPPFYERGARKDEKSCKTKWAHLKRTHDLVSKLKGLSGFQWNKEKGMNVTPDTQDAWNQVVKSNCLYKQFAHHGWVHDDAVSALVGMKAKGKKAHQGTQDQSEAASASPGQSSSSTPFNIPLSSFASSKRQVSSFNVSGQSSSSNKRSKQSQASTSLPHPHPHLHLHYRHRPHLHPHSHPHLHPQLHLSIHMWRQSGGSSIVSVKING
ncbi:hypothetical protein V8E52_007646 [Russula decolorans]